MHVEWWLFANQCPLDIVLESIEDLNLLLCLGFNNELEYFASEILQTSRMVGCEWSRMLRYMNSKDEFLNCCQNSVGGDK